MRSLLLVAFLAAFTPGASAQRMVSPASRFPGSHHAGSRARNSFNPLAFSDPFYADYLSSTGYPVASQPPVIIVQAAPAPASVFDPAPSPMRPLMIELQGDRYVQVSGEETSGAQALALSPDARTAMHPAVARDLPVAVLVFRDGHREEVSAYTITGGAIYAPADFYRDGSWNRKIELSSLDLPETLKSNYSRGLRFQLPRAPNEVIVGP